MVRLTYTEYCKFITLRTPPSFTPLLNPEQLQMVPITLQHMHIVNFLRVAPLAILVYEHLLTSDLEVEFIWKTKWGIVNILFLPTRYLPYFETALSIAMQFLPHASAETCKTLYAAVALLSIGFFVAEVVLTLRTWAACGGKKKLGILLSILFTGIFVVHVALASILNLKTLEFKLQDPLHSVLRGCLVTEGRYDLLLIDWSVLLAYDIVNMVLIMIPAYDAYKNGHSKLIKVVLHDVVALANIVVISKLGGEYSTIILQLGRDMHSIFACRVVLHAREEASKHELIWKPSLQAAFNCVFASSH
ncbi:hypothetical protein BDQ17DRAFT_1518634 [Cyathus striatus]|nr:hypothetical protein BDQ17DRAFT_1518634 [Cyathus striatus]